MSDRKIGLEIGTRNGWGWEMHSGKDKEFERGVRCGWRKVDSQRTGPGKPDWNEVLFEGDI